MVGLKLCLFMVVAALLQRGSAQQNFGAPNQQTFSATPFNNQPVYGQPAYGASPPFYNQQNPGQQFIPGGGQFRYPNPVPTNSYYRTPFPPTQTTSGSIQTVSPVGQRQNGFCLTVTGDIPLPIKDGATGSIQIPMYIVGVEMRQNFSFKFHAGSVVNGQTVPPKFCIDIASMLNTSQ